MSKPALSVKKREAFAEDAKTMSDADLAKKYKMSERTATNWRIRLAGRKLTQSEVKESLDNAWRKIQDAQGQA